MLYNKKIVIVVPAGRKEYMDICFPYIIREYDKIDEIRYWCNTNIQEDINWMIDKSKQYEKIKVDLDFINSPHIRTNNNINNFFRKCIDTDTIYLRLDDDVVWLEENYIEKMIDFRIKNPSNFLIYGNILNNAIIDYIHQRHGCFDFEKINYNCLDPYGWKCGLVAIKKHNEILNEIKNNNLQKFKFSKWILNCFERVSINSICWFGEEFAKFGGNVGTDEEQWLSVDKPKELNSYNLINGDAICVHFSFYTQKKALDNTDILNQYKQLSLSL